MMSELKLKVVRKVWETADACTFYFDNVAGNTLFYKPGQFFTFLFTINGQEVRRSYSLCTVPVKDRNPAITVKRVDKGLVSNYLLDQVREGDVLNCLHPAGVFFPDLLLSNKKEYFLIGAGSGITPLFSMLQAILLKEPASKVNLLFSNRSENDIIYKSKLEELELQFLDRLKVVHILSKPSENWLGFNGRLGAGLLSDLVQELNQFPKSDTLFFLCGPRDYMAICESTVIELGFEKDKIKKEDFAIAETKQKAGVEIGEEKVVKLSHKGQDYEFQLKPGQSILDGALENSIRIPYSCTNGVCTACIGTCVEGEVDISRSDVLSENEKKQGYILTCIGIPISQRVSVNID